MRITKETADNIANEVTKPLLAKVEAAKKSLNAKGLEFAENAIPKEVALLYKKHPNHLKDVRSVGLIGVGISRSIDVQFTKRIPLFEWQLKLNPTQAKEIAKLNDNISDAKLKYDETRLKIKNTLIGLGTYNRVKEQLPELEKYLPIPTNTSLVLPIAEVRKEIKAIGK